MNSTCVLDASAVLALLNGEPGADMVQAAIVSGAVISPVNLSEVVSKLVDLGMSLDEVIRVVSPLGLQSEMFDDSQAYRAGVLRRDTRKAGLSLGDRACIALAMQLGLPAITADRHWLDVSLPIEVKPIRD